MYCPSSATLLLFSGSTPLLTKGHTSQIACKGTTSFANLQHFTYFQVWTIDGKTYT